MLLFKWHRCFYKGRKKITRYLTTPRHRAPPPRMGLLFVSCGTVCLHAVCYRYKEGQEAFPSSNLEKVSHCASQISAVLLSRGRTMLYSALISLNNLHLMIFRYF